jgi:uncharacterized membrane protein
MEIFWILFSIAVVLTGPVAIIMVLVLRRRVLVLEMRLAGMGENAATARPQPAKTPHPAAAGETTSLPTTSTIAEPATPPPPRPARPAPTPETRPAGIPLPSIEAILGGKWLTWAGIIALFFGTAFFLGVDLGDHALSGPFQVLISLLVAGGFLVIGDRLTTRDERYLGLGLTGGGLALLYLGLFALYGFHQLVPALVVLPLLLAVSVGGALLSLRRDSQIIAAMTLTGALLTPVVLINLSPDGAVFDALLPYLAMVNLGAVLVGLRRGWAGLPLGSFCTAAFLVFAWWMEQPGREVWTILSITASWLVFVIAPWLQRDDTPFWSSARAAVLAANGVLYGLYWHAVLAVDGQNTQGLAISLLAVVYIVLSRVMKSRKGENPATRLTHTTGAALALVAVPLFLDMAWITVGWTALAAILIISGLREHDVLQRVTGLVFLLCGLFRMTFLDTNLFGRDSDSFLPVLNGDFWAGVPALVLLGWTFWAYRRWDDRLHRNERRFRPVFLLTGLVVLLWKLSFELGNMPIAGHSDRVWLWILSLWAVYALAMIWLSRRSEDLRIMWKPGYALLGLAAWLTGLQALGNGYKMFHGYNFLWNGPFLQGALLTTLLALTAWRLKADEDQLHPGEQRLQTPLILTAILLFFVKVSTEVLAFFELGFGATAASQAVRSQLTLTLVWGLYAGAVIWSGFAARFKPVRLLGMGLLLLTVGKLFIMDMQFLDKGYRIAAFVGLGVLLLIISVLYQREQARLASSRDEATASGEADPKE